MRVLLFHSISPPGLYFNNALSVESFERQMQYLSRRYAMLNCSQSGELSGYRSDKVNILLTFDDGFVDNFLIVAPILYRKQMSAIFFVIADCLEEGTQPSFVHLRHLALPLPTAYNTISVTHARAMMAFGMSIGSHGRSHIDYSAVSFDSGIRDAFESKQIIEGFLDVPVASFAFPWGRCKFGQCEIIKSQYKRIFVTERGFNSPNDTLFFRNEVANYPHLCCTASGALDFFSNLLRFTRKAFTCFFAVSCSAFLL